jgi:DNA-binding response OmpR family regulator
MKRILLCDDELHILRAAEFKFARSGYNVQTACNGAEAWRLIEQQPPDIVVTDCQMPILNGLELAKRIKEHPATCYLPVIMLSAKGFELSPEQLRNEYGILRLLCKPFSPRELFSVVEGLLDGHEAVGVPVLSGLTPSVPLAVSQWL